MKDPLITVIIPTKNRSNLLKRAINSVLNQTYQNFEILVIDDHSDEDIKSLLNKYNDLRIYYFKSEKQPSNANVCRNIGIDNANGEYIAMLDSDDEWLPEHLDLSLNYLINRNLDGVYGGYVLNNGIEKKEIESRVRLQSETMASYLLTDGVAVTPSQMYKTSCCANIRWNESLYRHQDFDFSIRFSLKYKFDNYTHKTAVVNWQAGEKRTEHLQSQKLFLEIYKENIPNILLVQYHRNVYNQIKERSDVSIELKEYFKKNIYFDYYKMSFNEYLGLKKVKLSYLRKFYMKLKFSILILIN